MNLTYNLKRVYTNMKIRFKVLKNFNFDIRSWNTVKYIDKFKLSPKIDNFNECGINLNERKETIIVSLTSYPQRMNELHFGLYSLFNQSFKPDKIILWLEHEKFPNKEKDIPKEVLKFKDYGLTIKWCDTMRSFCKIIPSLREYSDAYIVVADDDIFYQKNWLENMITAYKIHPKTIISTRTMKIKLDENNEIMPYETWSLPSETYESYLNFPTNVGGTLFFPNALSSIATDESLFLKLCPIQDDLWVWAMAVLNETKVTCIGNPFEPLTCVNIERELNLNGEHTLFEVNRYENDNQIKNVLEHFPEILEIIKKEK